MRWKSALRCPYDWNCPCLLFTLGKILCPVNVVSSLFTGIHQVGICEYKRDKWKRNGYGHRLACLLMKGIVLYLMNKVTKEVKYWRVLVLYSPGAGLIRKKSHSFDQIACFRANRLGNKFKKLTINRLSEDLTIYRSRCQTEPDLSIKFRFL